MDKEDPIPGLEILDKHIFMGQQDDTATVRLKNTGNIPLVWELKPNDPYFVVSPFTGKLAPGETVVSEIRVFKEELEEGVYSSVLLMETDQEIHGYIPLKIISYEEKKWLLDEKIIDAEYDRNADRIIAVTEQNNLLIIYPVQKEIQTIPLGLQPVCVSVHPDGKSALVGHIAAISHIDLAEKKIIKQAGLPFELFDLAMGKTNWAYITSSGHDHNSLYNYNLENEQLIRAYDVPIYSQSNLKIHPSGNYLYGSNTTIIPSDVAKVDVSEGLAKYVYDMPYHGTFAIGGDVWFAEDGTQFYSKAGHVFQIADETVFDLTHVGKLPSDHYFSTIAHSSRQGKIFGVHNPGVVHGIHYQGMDVLAKYNSSFQLLEETRLPGFIMNYGEDAISIVSSKALFSFFSADGRYYHILCEPNTEAASPENGAIITFDLN